MRQPSFLIKYGKEIINVLESKRVGTREKGVNHGRYFSRCFIGINIRDLRIDTRNSIAEKCNRIKNEE